MKKLFVLILSVLMFTNVYAESVNVKQETLNEDKEALIGVLEKGQCGQVCVRYERNKSGTGFGTHSFGFCRVSVTVCKE